MISPVQMFWGVVKRRKRIMSTEDGAQTASAVSAARLRQLEVGERRYRRLFEATPDLILTLDSHGRILSVNAAALSITGYQPEELIGRSYLELVHPQDQAASRARLAGAFSGEIQHRALRIIRADGQVRHLEISTGPYEADDASTLPRT